MSGNTYSVKVRQTAASFSAARTLLNRQSSAADRELFLRVSRRERNFPGGKVSFAISGAHPSLPTMRNRRIARIAGFLRSTVSARLQIAGTTRRIDSTHAARVADSTCQLTGICAKTYNSGDANSVAQRDANPAQAPPIAPLAESATEHRSHLNQCSRLTAVQDGGNQEPLDGDRCASKS